MAKQCSGQSLAIEDVMKEALPSTHPDASETGRSKGPVDSRPQAEVLNGPVTDVLIELPLWARRRLVQETNSIPAHSRLIVSLIPRSEKIPSRRPRRRWDVPKHGECYFASDRETVDGPAPMLSSTEIVTQPKQMPPESNSSRNVFSGKSSSARHGAGTGTEARVFTQPLFVTRRVVVTKSVGETRSKFTANRSEESRRDNGTRSTLVRPLTTRMSRRFYPPYQLRDQQPSRMYPLLVRDGRLRRLKRPLQPRSPQILFGSVISNKTTSLRLAKFGLYQMSDLDGARVCRSCPVGNG
ncbi:hypothetical protein BIW11_03953 [Tropilaelaps mercedesae]|uniref:Uncharacterized protein n=1 Tax=Tropilaelaps mercedesae TaxID=418985 RepID=A0A1V9XDE1_9ACAR|nr:hypothetical protein BIW11_03953 [Tropilaelaps mercedesae]